MAKAYIAVLSAQAELEVVATRQKTAEQFLEDVKSKLEAQTATELDRLRAESEYLAVVPRVSRPRPPTSGPWRCSMASLGLDPKTPLKLADLGQPDLEPEARCRRSAARSPSTSSRRRCTGPTTRSSRPTCGPSSISAPRYGYQAGRSGDLFQEPYDTWKVSVTMRFPLFDGLRSSGRRAQNTAQLEQVRQARIDKERAIAVEKSSAERELQKAIAFREAANKAHDAGLEALRMSHESFEQGLITSLDLLQAERTERQLESQRRRAELGVWNALFDYRRSLGLPPL